jgi:hypothetical protein
MAGLSKSRILIHRQCPKRLWLQIHQPKLAVEEADTTARIETGNRVGDLARSLHPDGVLIDGDNLSKALADTASALQGKRRPLFEATFQAGGALVRADLLLPVRGGFDLVEVKSSGSVKDYHLEDAAIQAWVAGKAGLPVKRTRIAHIDTAFVYRGDGDYQGLFAHQDISDTVAACAKNIPKWIKAAQRTLAGDEPEVEPGEQCHKPFPCPFSGYCSPHQGKGYPPEILPKAVAAQLRAAGYNDLRKVPLKSLSQPKHLRILRATKSGKAELDPQAGEQLRALGYPRYFMDFETIQFAVPIWPGTRPYVQEPFQWSCHIETRAVKNAHKAFLADGSGDPRRAFAESLIKVLKTDGPILVYHAPFERDRMRYLAETYPDLAPALLAAIERIVDLLPIAREHYYHREMRGSWSLKAVLPTIVPELAYDGMDVANGGMAQAAFAEILDRQTKPKRRAALRKALLVYCERDTWAMVEIARFFMNGSGTEPCKL